MKKLLLIACLLGFLLPHLSSQSIAAYKKSAEDAFAIQDYPTAFMHTQEVIKRDTSVNLDLLKIAMIASVEVCEFDEAERFMQMIAAIAPEDNDPKLLFYRAKNQHRQGNYEEAIQGYNDFINNAGNADQDLISLAKQKATECDDLLDSPLVNEPLNLDYLRMLGDLSSPGQSDFAMPFFNENIIVSKLTPPEQCECEKPCSDKMALIQRNDTGVADKLALPKTFKNVGHITYANEGQRAYFTSCKCKNDNFTCEIFYADRITGGDGWSSPVKLPSHINHGNSYTSTQPFYLEGRGNGNDTLFYVSNFHGGQATGRQDLDIFYSVVVGNDHKSSVNLGEPVNTSGDEVTPYFHKSTNTFYFSSNGHMTLGGYDFDIFRYIPPQYEGVDCSAEGTVSSYSRQVKNMGSPINTNFDDLYFSKEEGSERMIFSSNREGHKYEELEHCCPDVFEAQYVPTANIKVTLLCQGDTYCGGGSNPIENLASNNIIWKPASLPQDPVRDGSSFLFNGIPLERDFEFTAEVEGYDAEIKTINSGVCDGATVELTLLLTPVLEVTLNFEDDCGNDLSSRIDSVQLIEVFDANDLGSPLSHEGWTYTLCPNKTYRFSTTGSTFDFSPQLAGFEITTTCAPLNKEYTFKVQDKGIKETLDLPLYFDHDIPRPEMLLVNNRKAYIGNDSTNYKFNYALGTVEEPELLVENDTLSYDYYYKIFSSAQRVKRFNDFENCDPATNAVPQFFAELTANRSRLDGLADRIWTYYELGDTVIINIEGAASASGKRGHNLSLSGRRIASMRKYIYMYFKLLGTPICADRLQIKIVKKGSDSAGKNYPKTGDCRIYNTDASKDRNIKIVGLETRPTSCENKAILNSISDEEPCGRDQANSINGL